MGYASKLAQSYSNPDYVWNSLGAVGSTSAWDRGSNPLAEFRAIFSGSKKAARQAAGGGERPYAPSGPPKYGSFGRGASSIVQNLDRLSPENITANLNNYQNQVLAGRYLRSLRMDDLF